MSDTQIIQAPKPTLHYEFNEKVAQCLAIAIGSVALGVLIGYLGKLYFDNKAQKALQCGNETHINKGFWDTTIKNIPPEVIAQTNRERGKIFLYAFSIIGASTGIAFTAIGFSNCKQYTY